MLHLNVKTFYKTFKTFSALESWCHGNNEDVEYNRVWLVRVVFCSLQIFYSKSLMSNQISFCLLHMKNVNRKIFQPVVFSRSVSHGRGMSYIWSDDLMWDRPGLQRNMFLSPWPGRSLSLPRLSSSDALRRSEKRAEPDGNKEPGQICQSLAAALQTHKHTHTPPHRNTVREESWEVSVNTPVGVCIQWDQLIIDSE